MSLICLCLMIHSAQFLNQNVDYHTSSSEFIQLQEIANKAYEQENIRNFDKIFSKNIYIGIILKDSVGNVIMASGCLNLKDFFKDAKENELPYNMIINALEYNKKGLEGQR